MVTFAGVPSDQPPVHVDHARGGGALQFAGGGGTSWPRRCARTEARRGRREVGDDERKGKMKLVSFRRRRGSKRVARSFMSARILSDRRTPRRCILQAAQPLSFAMKPSTASPLRVGTPSCCHDSEPPVLRRGFPRGDPGRLGRVYGAAGRTGRTETATPSRRIRNCIGILIMPLKSRAGGSGPPAR